MPNHVDITFTAIGAPDRIQAFMNQAKGTRKPCGDPPESPNYDPHPPESLFEFDRLVPLPDDYSRYSYNDYGYDIECETWGIKWGAYRVKEPVQKRETEVTYNFTCAWGPPKRFCEKVSVQWPDLLFAISYGGEGPCLGHFSLHHGEYLLDEKGDYHDAPEEDESDEEGSYARYEAWQQQYRQQHDAFVQSLL